VPEATLGEILLSPPVLITLIVCAIVAGALLWVRGLWAGRRQQRALDEQRRQQETTVERLLEATTLDKQRLLADYEQQIKERDARIVALERQVERLRDRLTAGGVIGVFGGGRQRDAISALLLENEQLHELLYHKQEQLRELMADMTGKLLDRLDEQAQESARAVRYKQAMLSAFLEREETRALLNRMLSDGGLVQEGEVRELPDE
jgi:uncharacterized protein YecA (UPF0149 family)